MQKNALPRKADNRLPGSGVSAVSDYLFVSAPASPYDALGAPGTKPLL
jgi:hypothetical protein